jgi:hypothetical protein
MIVTIHTMIVCIIVLVYFLLALLSTFFTPFYFIHRNPPQLLHLELVYSLVPKPKGIDSLKEIVPIL